MSDKQNEAKSYREFWVNEYITSVHYAGDPFYGGKTGMEELPYIHVIEYEALAKLQAEINRLTYELDKSRQSHVNLIDKIQEENDRMKESIAKIKGGSECATNGTTDNCG